MDKRVEQALLKVTLVAHERQESLAAYGVLQSFYDSNQEAQERTFSSRMSFEGRQPTDHAFLTELLGALDTCREGSETGRRAAQVIDVFLRCQVHSLVCLSDLIMHPSWQPRPANCLRDSAGDSAPWTGTESCAFLVQVVSWRSLLSNKFA